MTLLINNLKFKGVLYFSKIKIKRILLQKILPDRKLLRNFSENFRINNKKMQAGTRKQKQTSQKGEGSDIMRARLIHRLSPYLLGEQPRGLTAERKGSRHPSSFTLLPYLSCLTTLFTDSGTLLDSVDTYGPSVLSSPTFVSWVTAEFSRAFSIRCVSPLFWGFKFCDFIWALAVKVTELVAIR